MGRKGERKMTNKLNKHADLEFFPPLSQFKQSQNQDINAKEAISSKPLTSIHLVFCPSLFSLSLSLCIVFLFCQ